MAKAKVIVTLSTSQAESLIKALGTVPKQSKTVEAVTEKVQAALTAATAE